MRNNLWPRYTQYNILKIASELQWKEKNQNILLKSYKLRSISNTSQNWRPLFRKTAYFTPELQEFSLFTNSLTLTSQASHLLPAQESSDSDMSSVEARCDRCQQTRSYRRSTAQAETLQKGPRGRGQWWHTQPLQQSLPGQSHQEEKDWAGNVTQRALALTPNTTKRKENKRFQMALKRSQTPKEQGGYLLKPPPLWKEQIYSGS